MPYAKNHKTESKERILSSATDLFSRYGFDKVSISQIMKIAKMTHGAFYSHFESKEALYRETFLKALTGSRAARLVKGPLSVKHLTAMVSSYWNLRELELKTKPGVEMILFNEIGNENPEVKKLFEASYYNLKKMLEIRLRALSKLKELPLEADRDKISDKARAIIASLVGAVSVARGISKKEEQNSVLESAQKQILIMLGINERDLENLLH